MVLLPVALPRKICLWQNNDETRVIDSSSFVAEQVLGIYDERYGNSIRLLTPGKDPGNEGSTDFHDYPTRSSRVGHSG